MKSAARPVDINRNAAAGGFEGKQIPISLQIRRHDGEIPVGAAGLCDDFPDAAENSPHLLSGCGGGNNVEALSGLPFLQL